MTCVYVAIGQKASSIKNVVRLSKPARWNTPSSWRPPASESAPCSTCRPTWLHDGRILPRPGQDALIIYDDLSGRPWPTARFRCCCAVRQAAKPIPGDVFYLHSRLLERAARVNADYVEAFTKGEVKGKTGSLTALPIIETQAGDVSAFVPTNVISITDGQIFLETSLFNAGIRPAINAGISVSRVGGPRPRPRLMKKPVRRYPYRPGAVP